MNTRDLIFGAVIGIIIGLTIGLIVGISLSIQPVPVILLPPQVKAEKLVLPPRFVPFGSCFPGKGVHYINPEYPASLIQKLQLKRPG